MKKPKFVQVLMDKERREKIQEHVDVIFAVFTIASFVATKVQEKKKSEGSEERPGDKEQKEAPVYNISSL